LLDGRNPCREFVREEDLPVEENRPRLDRDEPVRREARPLREVVRELREDREA